MAIPRLQLGEFMPFRVQCGLAGVPTAPDSAPTLTIYAASDLSSAVKSERTIPTKDRENVTALFEFEQFLDSSFSAQKYVGRIKYDVSASTYVKLVPFEIVAGGNNKGAYISMAYYPQPHATYVVGQLDGGTIETRRGPKV